MPAFSPATAETDDNNGKDDPTDDNAKAGNHTDAFQWYAQDVNTTDTDTSTKRWHRARGRRF